MKNILIINLRRYGDIFSSGAIAHSIKEKDANVFFLTYKEMEKATHLFKDIKQTFTIDRKKIITINKCDFISKSYAIESLYHELKPLKNIQWDNVINFSNDKTGSFICSYLSNTKEKTKYSGIRYNHKKNITYSNDWAIIFNDILTEYKYTPIHFLDCHLKMSNLVEKKDIDLFVTINDKNSKMAKESFDALKEKSTYGDMTYFVGIQIAASTKNKSIPKKTIQNLITKLLQSPGIIPILLVAPTESEKSIANDICINLKEPITIVESDFIALPSVLKNLNLLITPDTSVKHLADILKIPLIEISLGDAPLFKQGTRNVLNFLLSYNHSKREVDAGKSDRIFEQNKSITSSDIFQIIEYMRGKNKLLDIRLSKDVSLYRPIIDELGVSYQLLAGSGSIKEEAKRYISRLYLAYLFDLKDKDKISKEIENFICHQLNETLEEEISLTETMAKDILTSIRNLKEFHNDPKSIKSFLFSIDKIFSFCNLHKLSSIPALIFRARLEQMENKNIRQNINEIECSLYETKSEVHKLYKILSKIKDLTPEPIKDDFRKIDQQRILETQI